jgi:hypothetical protein
VAVVARLIAQQELRPDSLFALLTAATAAETDGISGTLIVKIPRKFGHVDVQFTTGTTHIELDM